MGNIKNLLLGGGGNLLQKFTNNLILTKKVEGG